MTLMHNPPHPGEILREDVLPALSLNVTQATAQLGVTRAALSRVLNGRRCDIAGNGTSITRREKRWPH